MEPKHLSPAEYRSLVEHAPIMIWRADRSTECDYFNHRWLDFTGRTQEQEAGNGWAEGVHPEDLDRCLKIYLGSFERREPFAMEYRLRRHDGAYRWLLDNGTPHWDEHGRFAGYLGSCIDVTDAVEAREALRLAHDAELRRLQNLLPICAGCKKIRDDAGSWHDVETYLKDKIDQGLTHTLCPGCMEAHYPDLGTSSPTTVASGR